MTNVPKNDYVNAFKPSRGPGFQVSEGAHTPEVDYVPSNPQAWGPKGAWGPSKTAEQLSFERQAASTLAFVNQDGACGRWRGQGVQQSRQALPALWRACVLTRPRRTCSFSSCRPDPGPVHVGSPGQPGGLDVQAEPQERGPPAQGLDAGGAHQLVGREPGNARGWRRWRGRHEGGTASAPRVHAACTWSILAVVTSNLFTYFNALASPTCFIHPVLRMPAAMPLMLTSRQSRSSALVSSARRRFRTSAWARLMTHR